MVAEMAAVDSLCLIVVDLVVDYCSVVMQAVAEAGIPLQMLGQSQGQPTSKVQIRSLPTEAEVKLLERAHWVHPPMFLALGHFDFQDLVLTGQVLFGGLKLYHWPISITQRKFQCSAVAGCGFEQLQVILERSFLHWRVVAVVGLLIGLWLKFQEQPFSIFQITALLTEQMQPLVEPGLGFGNQ